MKIKNLMAGLVLFAAVPMSFAGCSSYDEDDCTIIAYLKINDMLEKKLADNSVNDVLDFMQAYSTASWENMFDYNEDAVNSFAEKYYDESNDTFNAEKLEAGITSELWNYLNLNYTNAIPAKAQNPDEGRYYTITELKAKYPDYKELEIEDFRPMELINSVMSEKLFDYSFISEGDVNLRTLYVFYLLCKKAEKNATAGQDDKPSEEIGADTEKNITTKQNDTPSEKIDYKRIIASHFDGSIPANVNVNEVVSNFKRLSGDKDGLYENTQAGFEQFANDYFETDMFTGEDEAEY